MIVLAAVVEQSRGWGGPAAIFLTVLGFSIVAGAHKRYLTVKDQPLPSSPAEVTSGGVKPQVTAGSHDPVDPAGTPSPGGVAKAGNDLQRFVGKQLGRTRPADIIRAGKSRYGVSEATVKRAIRKARAGKP